MMSQKLLRLSAVQARTGKSRSDIYIDATFPKPVKIGAGARAAAWVEAEVDAWIAERIADREVA
jgi:prophage regulatory protein